MNRLYGEEGDMKESIEMQHAHFIPIIKMEAPDIEVAVENVVEGQCNLLYNYELQEGDPHDPLDIQVAGRLQGNEIEVKIEKGCGEQQKSCTQGKLQSQVCSSQSVKKRVEDTVPNFDHLELVENNIETKREGETMPEFERVDVVGNSDNQVFVKLEKDDDACKIKEESIEINSMEDDLMDSQSDEEEDPMRMQSDPVQVQVRTSDSRTQGELFMMKEVEKYNKVMDLITDIESIDKEQNMYISSKDGSYARSHTQSSTKVRCNCIQCLNSYNDAENLKQHSLLLLKLKKEQFKKCVHCLFTCKTPREMRKHNYLEHGEMAFSCPHCNYSCWRPDILSKHVLRHSDKKQHKCSECEYSSKTAYSLKVHMYNHSGQSPYQCKVCKKQCTSSSNLKSHMFTHTGERPYKCAQCSYAAPLLASLKKHMMVHSGEKPHKCPECGFATKEETILKTHMYRHTGGRPRPFLCDVCSATFSVKRALKRHLMLHSGIKPFKCTLCPYASLESAGLAAHMFKHTGESPYKCDKCEYVGASSTLLMTHSIVHSGVKPRKCPECEYSCRDSRGLRKHMLTHSGKQPLKCSECPYASRDQGALKMHIAWHSRRKRLPQSGRGNRKTKTEAAPNPN